MKQLFAAMIDALEAGERVVLCSILASSGSAPRGAGAKMAVFADGTTRGTIGGGAVERTATLDAMQILQSGGEKLQAFTLSPNQVNDIGMICGGAVTVYFQCFLPEDAAARRTLERIHTLLQGNADAWLFLQLEGGKVTKTEAYTQDELPNPALFGKRAQLIQGEPMVYTEPIVRAGQVYVFGGGHVGRALVPILAGVEFRVTLVDNRPEFAIQENFPQAQRVVLGEYTNIGDKITIGSSDYVVIMTTGHQADFEVLQQVLPANPRYIGCIGSRAKIARTNERLAEAGFSPAQIARIHAPIGLSILAQTPGEIAISIAAEMIRCRAENE
ncbi:MAG: xanthine dehydrogenase accessory protein XdhC [Oscillospiraceae bacterium]|jgi:xanthine dehydrogenase accessory factor|nr:xanthine dehydrogenase accessory protein XdhC [Oscillospiraceae bacterium]